MEEKKERHEWHWGKPSTRLRECSKCGKVSSIRSHSSLGGCKPKAKAPDQLLTPEEIIDDFARDIKYVHPVGAHEKYMEARNKAIAQLLKVKRPDRDKVRLKLARILIKYSEPDYFGISGTVAIDEILSLFDGERE